MLFVICSNVHLHLHFDWHYFDLIFDEDYEVAE